MFGILKGFRTFVTKDNSYYLLVYGEIDVNQKLDKFAFGNDGDIVGVPVVQFSCKDDVAREIQKYIVEKKLVGEKVNFSAVYNQYKWTLCLVRESDLDDQKASKR